MEFASKCVYDYGGYSSEESFDEADEQPSYSAPGNYAAMPDASLRPRLASQTPAPPPPGSPKICATTSPTNCPPPPQLANMAPVPPPPVPAFVNLPSVAKKHGAKKPKKVRKSDTNIISVKFDCLEEQTFTTTAQPIKCEKCSAVMTVLETTLNNLDSQNSFEMKWVCAFCGHSNSVSAERLANPRNADMLFVPEGENSSKEDEAIKPKEESKEGEQKEVDEKDDSVLLFTIDISGSMGCTVAVSAPSTNANNSSDDDSGSDDNNATNMAPQRKSKGLLGSLGKMVGYNSTRGAQQQQPPRPRSSRQRNSFDFAGTQMNNNYVSRLDATKTALVQQIKDLKTNKPRVKLGVVTFCTNVEYLADGTGSKQKKLNQGFVNDKEDIQKEGMKCELPGPVSDSAQRMKRAIMQMHPTSMTALGPALLYSVAIAGRQNGSKVIMCTDGMANVGIGSLDSSQRDDEFYTYAAEYANELGVSVSVLAIEGSEVGLASLGQVADLTNGAVNIVKSTSLGTEYSGIVSQRIVGSHVEVTVILHSSLYIRDQLDPADKSNSSKTFKIGNVSADTENFFEFGFKPKEKRKVSVDTNNPEEPTKTENETDAADQEQAGTSRQSSSQEGTDVAIKVEPDDEKNEDRKEEVKELPFQIQITYTNRHKVKMTRVITKKMPSSKKRDESEKDVNIALLGAHSVQNTAAISKEREYTKARFEVASKKMMMNRMACNNAPTTSLRVINQANARLDVYDADLSRQTAQEYAMNLNLSDSDSDGSSAPASLFEKKQKKKAMRMKLQSDRSANVMFANAKCKSKSFGWGK